MYVNVALTVWGTFIVISNLLSVFIRKYKPRTKLVVGSAVLILRSSDDDLNLGKENSVKTVFYPELQGINIKELKEELIREEAEEDLGTLLQPQNNKEAFTIEAMPDINMNDLY